MQFFTFKCHAASEDKLHTPDAANRIAYKFCKALFPRMWTRWCTDLNVKKKTSLFTQFLWTLLEDFLKAIISLCCCYR